MSRLIRMDSSGHTTLAEWSAAEEGSIARAVEAFREQLEAGYFAVVPQGERAAEHVRELPVDAPLVILRKPIVGG